MLKKILKKIIYRIRGEYTIAQLREMGLRVGKKFDPQLGYELDPSHCWLIEIGDNVTFGPHVRYLHMMPAMHNVLGYTKIGRVRIGNNVFIGAGSIVLPNVQIGIIQLWVPEVLLQKIFLPMLCVGVIQPK